MPGNRYRRGALVPDAHMKGPHAAQQQRRDVEAFELAGDEDRDDDNDAVPTRREMSVLVRQPSGNGSVKATSRPARLTTTGISPAPGAWCSAYWKSIPIA